VNVEELAQEDQIVEGFGNLKRRYDVTSLQLQEQYFGYTYSFLVYANYEGRFLRKKLTKRVYEPSPELTKPPPYI
jgi:hypothetical protein